MKARKAKDVPTDEWLVMADKVREEATVDICPVEYRSWYPSLLVRRADHTLVNGLIGRTLKWVPAEVIDALARLVPHVQVWYSTGPGSNRLTSCFPALFVERLLTALDLDITKYSTTWNLKSITNCALSTIMKESRK